MSRAEFDKYYEDAKLPLLTTVRENHWQTWIKAQDAILSAHGPVTMLTMDHVIELLPPLPSDANTPS